MKRRIIALMLAGILSISSLGGLNVYAMEDGETESQTESDVEADTEASVPIETKTEEETATTEVSTSEMQESSSATKESLAETEEIFDTQPDAKEIMNTQEELDAGNATSSDSESDVTAPKIDVDSLNVDMKSAGLEIKLK